MAEIIPLEEVNALDIMKRIHLGEIFIYPTDTVYGLGCDATNEGSAKIIRVIKQRFDKPFSVIAPNKLWITRNFNVSKSYIDKLPGPFTYVLQARRHNLVAPAVAHGDKLGVRIPDHRFTSVIQRSRSPFVSTSVNLTGEALYTDIRKIPRDIMDSVDVIIDAGKLDSKPSVVLDLTESLPKILRL